MPPTSSSGWSRTTSPRSRPGESREALLLTPKARVIAPLRVLRRSDDGLPPADGARARRGRALAPAPGPLRCEVRDRAGGARVGDRARRGRGDPDPDYGVPAREVLDAGEADGDVGSWSGCGSRRERRASAARSTTASSRPRRASSSARSRSRRAATRARSRSRACTTAGRPIGGSACSSSRRPCAGDRHRAPARREGRRQDHERGRPALALGTCGKRWRTAPSSTVEGRHAKVRPARFELATSASAGQRSIP